MIPASKLNPKYNSPELTKEVKRGFYDVIKILVMMIAMIWLFVYVSLNMEAVDTLAEFYQSEVCSFILDHQIKVSISCFLVGILGCAWWARK